MFYIRSGILLSYHIIVRGVDLYLNKSRVLTNVSIDAGTPTLLLANLTEGVTYTVSVAAANTAGIGPYSAPATLRLDPITKRLDQSTSHRFVNDFTAIFSMYIFFITKKTTQWRVFYSLHKHSYIVWKIVRRCLIFFTFTNRTKITLNIKSTLMTVMVLHNMFVWAGWYICVDEIEGVFDA